MEIEHKTYDMKLRYAV